MPLPCFNRCTLFLKILSSDRERVLLPMFKITAKCKGFTLIESIVFLLLFTLISVVFLQTYIIGTRLILESKKRLGATALANQKMEIVRSIDYDAIGTKHWNGSSWVYGIPGGDLLEDEVVAANGGNFVVHTFVQYVDDSFDGTVTSGTPDAIPTDYKRARITVSWGNFGEDQTVAIFGNFSPNGVETSGGGGVFSINVLDGSGAGVSGATVHITNPTSSIDITSSTDSTGNIMLPGAPAGTQKYVLAVSKNGYYGVTTYAPYPTSVFKPLDTHASVVSGTLNQKTMIMDRSSDIHFLTQDPFGTDIPSIQYTIAGGRVIGLDAVTNANVYGFTSTGTTDASGEASYPSESPGQYTVGITSAGYELYKLVPEGSARNSFTALAGVTSDITAVLLDRSLGSVLLRVQNQTGGTAIPGATVTLSSTSLGYSQVVTSDQYGYAYFPTTSSPLVAGTYDITVSADNFDNATDTVSINGALEQVTVIMIPH